MSGKADQARLAMTSVDSVVMEVLFPVDITQKLNFQRAVY